MKSQSSSSSHRRSPAFAAALPAIDSDDAPTRIVLGDDPSLFADSHQSTVEVNHNQLLGLTGGPSGVVINDDRTRISKRPPSDEAPPPIHIGPLETRQALEGESLDHYKLEKYVGGGGMGAVYRALDTRLGRLVAVKILSRDQSDSETVRRFRNEAQSTARLDHPNIARAYYIGEDKGWNFIVFEFIEGMNLREMVVERGPLPLNEALHFTLQVAQALDHASARDVVHRDIKPSNVLVARDGTLKLVDMGLARLHQVEASSDDLTQSGVTLGTFDYIPPEQARDPRNADVRSDIYSLGCTLYFMLVGRPPFPEGTAVQKLFHHVADEPPDVRLFRPDVPEEVVALLAKMLAKKPEQRFQTPQELIAGIGRISQRLQLDLVSSSSQISVNWPPQAPPAKAWWSSLLPLAVALAIIAVLALLPENFGMVGAEKPKLESLVARPLPAISPVVDTKASATAPSTSNEKTARAIDLTSVKPIAEKLPATPETKTPDDKSSAPKLTEPDDTASPPVVTPPADRSDKIAQDSPRVELPKPADSPMKEVAPKVVTPESPIKPVVKRRIIVSGTTQREGDQDTVVLSSLAEACSYASRHSEIETIELAVSKQFLSSPLKIQSTRLTIKAASGFSPEIIFRPSADATRDDRHLIQLESAGASVAFQKLRFRIDMPGSREDWVVFQYAKDGAVELLECVTTVVNTLEGIRNAQQVALFEPAPLLTTTTVREAASDISSAQVVIRKSILRGDATILRLPDDQPIRLQITDSFVDTRDHLLNAAGALSRSVSAVRVSIERSTIAAMAGLVIHGTRSDAPYRTRIEIDASASVFVTDAASPLLELRGGEPGDEARTMSYNGNDNYYPRTTKFLRRIVRQDGLETPYDVDLTELPRWAIDRNQGKGAIAGAAADLATHDQLPAEYALKSPLETAAGCDLLLVPALEAAKRPILGSPNMTGMKPEMNMSVTPSMMDEKLPARANP